MIVYLFAAWAADSTVTVPLEVWKASESRPAQPPAVALGAARYVGSADPESMTLDLHLSLDVSLSGDGRKLVPLLGQDVWVIKHEQDGWEKFWDKPAPEVSPVVKAFQDLTIRKWQEYLATRKGAVAEAGSGNVVSAKELVR